MWLLVLLGVPAMAALTLWFTVWAERRIDTDHPADGRTTGPLAYVLVQAAPGHAHDVASAASTLPWVQETGIVQGPFDVIVRVGAGAPEDAERDLSRIAGVLRVLPCRASAAAATRAMTDIVPTPARSIVLEPSEGTASAETPQTSEPALIGEPVRLADEPSPVSAERKSA